MNHGLVMIQNPHQNCAFPNQAPACCHVLQARTAPSPVGQQQPSKPKDGLESTAQRFAKFSITYFCVV